MRDPAPASVRDPRRDPRRDPKRRDLLAVAFLGALAPLAAGCGTDSASAKATSATPATGATSTRLADAGETTGAAVTARPASGPGWHGTVPPNARPKPSFTLTDTSGAPFVFTTATAGRPVLLFFGFTNCPDVCPTTMADIAAARTLVPTRIADAVRTVFVTTDPARDTPAVLRRWLDQFDSTFIGLTGDLAEIDAAQRAVGIPLAIRPSLAPSAAPTADYSVAHAAQVAGYGADDRLRVLYFANATVTDYAADLPELVDAR
ncbi:MULTISPECIES: SCO family protein [Parafrankia]|uniref:SCO family protein n=1 Tax=Parafrankia TaxID=2994362 RepID=UPI000B82D8C5|nr:MULTISPECIES: SCO family protein [Parafrankia]MBE3203795.1 SCO family protein [Parafrankia sp. CH37]